MCYFRLLFWYIIWEGDFEMELEVEEVYCGVRVVKIKEDEVGLDCSF